METTDELMKAFLRTKLNNNTYHSFDLDGSVLTIFFKHEDEPKEELSYLDFCLTDYITFIFNKTPPNK